MDTRVAIPIICRDTNEKNGTPNIFLVLRPIVVLLSQLPQCLPDPTTGLQALTNHLCLQRRIGQRLQTDGPNAGSAQRLLAVQTAQDSRME